MEPMIGLELEFHLAYEDGSLANEADLVLADSRAGDYLIRESAKSMVEVIAPPSSDLSVVHQNFLKGLSALKEICDDYSLLPVPSSSIGPESAPISNDPERVRGMKKRIILGDELRDLEHHICGTHIHIDKLETAEEIHDQYVVMQAMDPAFALLSSTPFFLGQNTKKDYRVDIYRNQVFGEFPLQGQLLPYPVSYEDIVERQRESLRSWVGNGSSEGFAAHDTCWGPIRMMEKTIESRCADANVFSQVMGLAALYQGVCNYLSENKPEVVIGEGNFFKEGNQLVIPSYEWLKEAENAGIREGVHNSSLHEYLTDIVSLAKRHSKQPSYLEPLAKTLAERKTMSDRIIHFANGREYNHSIDEDTACDVRKYINELYQKDLEVMR
ncbi:MAG: glutamate-cysteine ligase family protein [Candidatus Woesearchaeota archaeon]